MFSLTSRAVTSAARVARTAPVATRSCTGLAAAAFTAAPTTRSRSHLQRAQSQPLVPSTPARFSHLSTSHRIMASAVAAAASPPLPVLDPITESNSVFFLCDIQETFRGKIIGYEPLIHTAAFLAKASNVLSIPCVTTEQKPFKPTVSELSSLISPSTYPHHSLFLKSSFSMVTPEVAALLASPANIGKRHAVLFGIETHVCVLQTALDLLRRGYHVHVVVDAVSSQNDLDRKVAIKRFKAEAARSTHPASVEHARGVMHLTTAESVLFEILKDAQHPKFKELVPALKELAHIKKGGVAPSALLQTQGAKL